MKITVRRPQGAVAVMRRLCRQSRLRPHHIRQLCIQKWTWVSTRRALPPFLRRTVTQRHLLCRLVRLASVRWLRRVWKIHRRRAQHRHRVCRQDPPRVRHGRGRLQKIRLLHRYKRLTAQTRQNRSARARFPHRRKVRWRVLRDRRKYPSEVSGPRHLRQLCYQIPCRQERHYKRRLIQRMPMRRSRTAVSRVNQAKKPDARQDRRFLSQKQAARCGR